MMDQQPLLPKKTQTQEEPAVLLDAFYIDLHICIQCFNSFAYFFLFQNCFKMCDRGDGSPRSLWRVQWWVLDSLQ
jgi:hypothetical protein